MDQRNKFYNEIGRRICDLRHEIGMSQAELAEALDISVKHMSEVERGLSSLSLEKMSQLCDILFTTMDFLVRGIDPRTEELANVPNYIVELYNSEDEARQSMFREYMVLFKKIWEHK